MKVQRTLNWVLSQDTPPSSGHQTPEPRTATPPVTVTPLAAQLRDKCEEQQQAVPVETEANATEPPLLTDRVWGSWEGQGAQLCW